MLAQCHLVFPDCRKYIPQRQLCEKKPGSWLSPTRLICVHLRKEGQWPQFLWVKVTLYLVPLKMVLKHWINVTPWGNCGSRTVRRLPFHFSLSCTGEGNSNPLQCSCLENPRDRGAWWAAVYGVAQSWTRLKRLSSSSSSSVCILIPNSQFSLLLHVFPLINPKEGMATHSSALAWRIPGTGKPGGLPSMGSHRVGHDWSDLAAAAE